MYFATIRQSVIQMIVAMFKLTVTPKVRFISLRSRTRGDVIPKLRPNESHDNALTFFVNDAIIIPSTIPHKTGKPVYLTNFIIMLVLYLSFASCSLSSSFSFISLFLSSR